MFFEITYRPGASGCPEVFDGDLDTPWDWQPYDPDIRNPSTRERYVYRARHDFIDFDFCDEWLVSRQFMKLAMDAGLNSAAMPVDIYQIDGTKTDKSYVFLRTSDYLSILDENKSAFAYEQSVETGEIVRDRYFPEVPHYESISRFVVDPAKVGGRHLFRCIDVLHRYVCSPRFKESCEREGLKGLLFTPIDENFRVGAYW